MPRWQCGTRILYGADHRPRLRLCAGLRDACVHASVILQRRPVRRSMHATDPVSAWRVVPDSTWAMRIERAGRVRVRAGSADTVGDTDTAVQCVTLWWGLHHFILVHGGLAMPGAIGAV